MPSARGLGAPRSCFTARVAFADLLTPPASALADTDGEHLEVVEPRLPKQHPGLSLSAGLADRPAN